MSEEGKVSVTLKYGTRITGEYYEAGDSVEVYPAERDHLVHHGYVDSEASESTEELSDFGGGAVANKDTKSTTAKRGDKAEK